MNKVTCGEDILTVRTLERRNREKGERQHYAKNQVE